MLDISFTVLTSLLCLENNIEVYDDSKFSQLFTGNKKVFAPRQNPRIPSIFWVWKSADFQERESYDMLGISYDNHPRLKHILMPESWIGWPLRKDYIAPNFYEIQDAH